LFVPCAIVLLVHRRLAMHTDFKRDDTAGLAPVVSEPVDRGVISIGDLAAIIVSDAAVRLRSNFTLPKVRAARTVWEE
jgi:hypothetical protein